MARRKLSRHHLDPYQRAAFRWGIIHHNTGKEERDPTLELAMEYTGACQDMVFFELGFRPICLIARRLPITFLWFLLFSYDFMTL